MVASSNEDFVMTKFAVTVLLIGALFIFVAYGQTGMPLKLSQTIPIPGVEGRIDHLSADIKGQKLFVAALGNNTVEILDLAQGKRIRSITGLREPQGIVYIPQLDQVIVANGDDGTVRWFDAKSFATIATVKLGDDADNVRYESSSGRIIVGYGEGALGFVDSRAHTIIASVKLSGHPESFQLEKSRPRIYVNVPNAGHIAVVDSAKRTLISTWPMGQFHANFPMALDEDHHRLLIGTRNPARLVVLDTETGKQTAVLNISGDTDDVFFDQENKRVYVSAGDGYIDVFNQVDADHYQPIPKIATAPGARTSLFVPELRKLFVAVPHRGTQEPAIRIYDVVK
jgi:DNA-binding beta-propeller fold protein YncE